MFHLFTFHYFHLLNFFRPVIFHFPILFNCLEVPPPHLLKKLGFYCISLFPPCWKKSSFKYSFFYIWTYFVLFSASLPSAFENSQKLMLFKTWLVIFLLCLAPKIASFPVTNTLKQLRILLTSHFKKEKREGGNISVTVWHVSSHHLTVLKMKKEMRICFALY